MSIKKIKNYLSLFLGFSFIIGIAFAANSIWNVNNSNIPQKIATNSVSSDEFNRIVYTLKNIYNDGTYLGINQPIPESALDVNGDLTVRNINGKDGNYAAFGCSTLGTNNGKFECHSSYHWVYSSWNTCTKTCGGGTQSRTVVCRRDDNQIVNNTFCGTPVLSQNCNTQACCTPTTKVIYNGNGNCNTACSGPGTGGRYCSKGIHKNTGTEGMRWMAWDSCSDRVRGWSGDCGQSPGNTTSCSNGYEEVEEGKATCTCSCP